jgi:hypothetical protein
VPSIRTTHASPSTSSRTTSRPRSRWRVEC